MKNEPSCPKDERIKELENTVEVLSKRLLEMSLADYERVK